MTSKEIHNLIRYPELIDNDTLDELLLIINEYPYFHLARILYLKCLYSKNTDKFRQELCKSSVFLPNKKQLFKYLNEDIDFSCYLSKIETTENKNDSIIKTEETLLDFEIADIDTLSEYNIEAKDWDASEDAEVKDNKQLIDDFIKTAPRISKTKTNEVVPINLVEDSELQEECMTETLARIYVKQKLYRKAIAIYEKLSLKNPQKSVYFVNLINEINEIINDK